MGKRYVIIWFRYLQTDWFTRREPGLATMPFVLYRLTHGRMVVTAANKIAESSGIFPGTVLADARAIVPSLQVKEDLPDFFKNKLKEFGEWFVRYSPVVAVDPPDSIIIEASGCVHLWGSEFGYLEDITKRLLDLGYITRAAMADSIGAAWALTHYGEKMSIVQSGYEIREIGYLAPESLRISMETSERLHKLGLHCINDFIQMPASVLRRRFGNDFIQQLQYALGYLEEHIQPIEIPPLYQERLHCLEPIVTATGIEHALKNLLGTMCCRLLKEENGLRTAILKAYRVDGKIEKIKVSVNRPSSDAVHLFKLFELKIHTIEPSFGIELFILDALKVEENNSEQEECWKNEGILTGNGIAQLIDRIAIKIGEENIHRYLPDEHYLPERSVKKTCLLEEQPAYQWKSNQARPIQLLTPPEPILVTAPIPDYPPMLFRYKNNIHRIVKADGPERIEQEWWLKEGRHRDYYYVEDEDGCRYWLFRSGHYDGGIADRWFLHGYCA